MIRLESEAEKLAADAAWQRAIERENERIRTDVCIPKAVQIYQERPELLRHNPECTIKLLMKEDASDLFAQLAQIACNIKVDIVAVFFEAKKQLENLVEA